MERRFYDTEHDTIITESELRAEFHPSEEFPVFELWIREITGKNSTLELIR